MIHILLADDHAILRQALVRTLGQYEDIEVAAEVADSAEIEQQLQHHGIDVILLDISMPGPGILDHITRLKSRHPEVAILILSTHPEDLYAIRVLRAGADGYIMKDRPLDVLEQAIRRVHAGGKFVSETLAEQMALQLGGKGEGLLHESLSKREFQILTRIAAGKPVREIAAELHISPKTVNTYRARMLDKMGFKSNTELIRYALEQGITE